MAAGLLARVLRKYIVELTAPAIQIEFQGHTGRRDEFVAKQIDL